MDAGVAAASQAPIRVVFALLPHSLVLDWAGPAEALRIANQLRAAAYLPPGLGDPVFYALLFAIILVRPSGLFGTAVSDIRAVRR